MVEDLVPKLRAALTGVLPAGWRDSAPWGHPAQSELALISGVFAAQLTPQSVSEIVDTVMRRSIGRSLDDLSRLVDLEPVGVAGIIGERWGDSTVLGVPRRRAEVIHEAARLLLGTGIRTAADFQGAVREREASVSSLLQAIRGVGPGTWASVAFMFHAPARPLPDVCEYLRGLMGPELEDLDADELRELIRRTARGFASEERVMNYALRRHVEQLGTTVTSPSSPGAPPAPSPLG